MRRLATLVLLSAFSCFSWAGNTSYLPKEIAADVMTVKAPTLQAVKKGSMVTEIFMDLINRGEQTHTVIAAISPEAKETQLHRTVRRHGQNMMQQINNISITPHHDRMLQRGQLHIMLIGLKDTPAVGKQIPVTLVFSDGSDLTVFAKVTQDNSKNKTAAAQSNKLNNKRA